MAANAEKSLPESWDVRRLDEVAVIIDSLHKTPSYSATGLPMVRVTDVQGGFLNLSEALRVPKEVFQEFTRRYTPKRGDRVSIDTGFALRSWQSDYVKAVLAELGLPLPS